MLVCRFPERNLKSKAGYSYDDFWLARRLLGYSSVSTYG